MTGHHVLASGALHPGRLHEGAVLRTASLVLHVHHRLLQVHIVRQTGAAWVLQARHGTLEAVHGCHVGQLTMVVTGTLRDQHTVRRVRVSVHHDLQVAVGTAAAWARLRLLVAVAHGVHAQVDIASAVDVLDLVGATPVILHVRVIVDGVGDAEDFTVQSLLDLSLAVAIPQLLELALQVEEDASRDEGIATGLMHCTNAVHVELLGDFSETTRQIVDIAFNFLAVVVVAEEPLEALQELVLLVRQVVVEQVAQQIAEIDAAVEREPVGAPIHAQAGLNEVLREQMVRDTVRLVALELQALLAQHGHRIFHALVELLPIDSKRFMSQ